MRATCARALAAALAALHALAAAAAGEESFPRFGETALRQGRAVWLANCRACHATDIAGAPRITDKAAWAPRVKKGREALYRSALNGLFGPKGTEMPARGGNAQLTDGEVRAAVDYMVTAVTRSTHGDQR